MCCHCMCVRVCVWKFVANQKQIHKILNNKNKRNAGESRDSAARSELNQNSNNKFDQVSACEAKIRTHENIMTKNE